jgi:predicted transcriptional regulator
MCVTAHNRSRMSCREHHFSCGALLQPRTAAKEMLTFRVEFTYKKHMKPVEFQGKCETKTASRGEIRLSLVVSPELNKTLENLAENSHSTKSEILRKAIALFDLALQARRKDQKIGILDKDDQVVKEIVGI